MAGAQTQITASVSPATKHLLDEYARSRRIRKSPLVESALLHHFQALRDLPAEVIIPPRVVVSRKSGERIMKRIKKPARPTRAMKALFANGGSQ